MDSGTKKVIGFTALFVGIGAVGYIVYRMSSNSSNQNTFANSRDAAYSRAQSNAGTAATWTRFEDNVYDGNRTNANGVEYDLRDDIQTGVRFSRP